MAQFHLEASGILSQDKKKIGDLKRANVVVTRKKSILCNSKIVQLVWSQQWQKRSTKVSNPSLSLVAAVNFIVIVIVGEVGEGTPGLLDGEGAR